MGMSTLQALTGYHNLRRFPPGRTHRRERTGGIRVTKTTDAAHFRHALLQILQAGPGEDERLLARFESRRQPDQPLYSSVLYILTHLTFSESEATRHWRRIRVHRDRLRFAL